MILALLEFSSGTLGTLHATTAAYPGYPRRLEITGTEGTVILEHDTIVQADLRTTVHDLITENIPDQNLSASSPVVSDVRGHQRAIPLMKQKSGLVKVLLDNIPEDQISGSGRDRGHV